MDATVATAGKECQLGTDPAKFLERFEDWYEHHDLLADTMGVEANKKLKLLLLWGGKNSGNSLKMQELLAKEMLKIRWMQPSGSCEPSVAVMSTFRWQCSS